MDEKHKRWNEKQKPLRGKLINNQDLVAGVALFFKQHAMVHAGVVTACSEEKFTYDLWRDACEAVIRHIDPKSGPSIVWHI